MRYLDKSTVLHCEAPRCSAGEGPRLALLLLAPGWMLLGLRGGGAGFLRWERRSVPAPMAVLVLLTEVWRTLWL